MRFVSFGVRLVELSACCKGDVCWARFRFVSVLVFDGLLGVLLNAVIV